MPRFTKIALATASILAAGPGAVTSGQAVASSADWAQIYVSSSVAPCPTLEGYPDCHPDSHLSWGEYSAGPKGTANKRSSYRRGP